ncbi:MAG TPA: dihydroorotase [Candidatus Omnitrophota bacterium]|jgi:dihydroorotase|nr:dihydroorotase [Candidatus Omnitrophota bacterium]HPN57200.1 dihydroorotase [Candidatus Omnitrophota bacterium]
MAVLIKNALIVNADKMDPNLQDILIDKGLIVRVGPGLPDGQARVMDVKGKHVFPGLIDLHVHLRQPGREDKETIETGSRAAVKGGFTTIVCMPNTKPVIDNAMIVEAVVKEARRVGLLNIIPAGAMTRGQNGEELTDMFELKEAGCLALTDDGRSVANSQTLRLALDYARMAGLLFMEHCQDLSLSSGGVMNESYTSTLLGMKGDPVVAETVIVARDIEIVHYLKTRIHLQHMSAARSVELVRWAKSQGIQVTAEATPHHFTLTDEAVKSFHPNTKVNPPLRTAVDVEAVRQGLKDGTIDCIASDHAPHTVEDKEVGFDHAPFGVTGLETALALGITELVSRGVLTLNQLVDRMSAAPARIIGLERKGAVREGYDADLTVVDIDEEWLVKAEGFASKAVNSPFIGRTLKGKVKTTLYGGKIVYQDD